MSFLCHKGRKRVERMWQYDPDCAVLPIRKFLRSNFKWTIDFEVKESLAFGAILGINYFA